MRGLIFSLAFITAMGAAFAADPTMDTDRRAVYIGSSPLAQRLPSMPLNPPPVPPNIDLYNPSPGGYVPPQPPPPEPEPEPKPPMPSLPSPPSPPREYTVDDCMDALSACIRTALPGGLTDLYDPDMRSDILANANLCASTVDYCIANVRVRHRPVYDSAADVWFDFNSRVIVPSYFAFVIRQTGLTPNQAEHVCLMLDKSVSGTSFAPNINTPITTLDIGGIKFNRSRWVSINDRMTGNARWDAGRAECMIRVAAYNRDNAITNSWLFGIAGDDRPAEVWRRAGDVFTCNRDLFGFGLMTQTKTVAVVGIGGGAVVGAGTGAIIGHNREEDQTLQGALIGAGTGAAAGGVATAITAFVERNNINCRIGDNLAQIGYNKSGKIDSLKDFYVKWNLDLPEVITPEAPADSCESVKTSCGKFRDAYSCGNVQIRHKRFGEKNFVPIDGACVPSGDACIVVPIIMQTNEICE